VDTKVGGFLGAEQEETEYNSAMSVDESKFDYNYVPEHLKEEVKNWHSLSVGERVGLTCELSLATWEKLGVVYDPTKPMDKTIRRINRSCFA
jgi:hypothetical protein